MAAIITYFVRIMSFHFLFLAQFRPDLTFFEDFESVFSFSAISVKTWICYVIHFDVKKSPLNLKNSWNFALEALSLSIYMSLMHLLSCIFLHFAGMFWNPFYNWIFLDAEKILFRCFSAFERDKNAGPIMRVWYQKNFVNGDLFNGLARHELKW